MDVCNCINSKEYSKYLHVLLSKCKNEITIFILGLIKENLPDADLGVMSKAASTMWKKCSSYVRQVSLRISKFSSIVLAQANHLKHCGFGLALLDN